MVTKGNIDLYDDKAYKAKLVQTLQAFTRFCEANGLAYMACAGTCIGAVRHHGFIPWDDDIDVFMSRADFERLVSLKNKLPEGYSLVQEGENGYYAPIPKFYDNRTTLWEEKSLPAVIGAYIDIFPLDECDDDADYCKRLKKEYEYCYLHHMDSRRKWLFEDFVDMALHLHPMGFIRLLKNTFYHAPKAAYYKKRLDGIRKKMQEMKGSYVVPWDGLYATPYPKRLFEKTVPCDFEGLTIQIPAMYDEYLTQTYGNYMQLPPVEKRKSTHSHFYLDLDRGMTLDEVRKMIRMK